AAMTGRRCTCSWQSGKGSNAWASCSARGPARYSRRTRRHLTPGDPDRRATMKQYLLSIIQPDEPPPPDVMARMPQIMANVNALVDEAKQAGVWAFNGALIAPSTAPVVCLAPGLR